MTFVLSDIFREKLWTSKDINSFNISDRKWRSKNDVSIYKFCHDWDLKVSSKSSEGFLRKSDRKTIITEGKKQ